jgi:hypothetical protein
MAGYDDVPHNFHLSSTEMWTEVQKAHRAAREAYDIASKRQDEAEAKVSSQAPLPDTLKNRLRILSAAGIGSAPDDDPERRLKWRDPVRPKALRCERRSKRS